MTPSRVRFDGAFAALPEAESQASRSRIEAALRPGADFWVFSYATLIWRPCFEVAERRRARLDGVRRSLCVWTVEARGTPETPGIGFGLEPAAGTSCIGFVDRVTAASRDAALTALWRREMLTGIYRPRLVTAHCGDATVEALVFLVDQAHPQYTGRLSIEAQASLVASAHGSLGSCLESVQMTVDALSAADIEEPELSAVLDRARSIR